MIPESQVLANPAVFKTILQDAIESVIAKRYEILGEEIIINMDNTSRILTTKVRH